MLHHDTGLVGLYGDFRRYLFYRRNRLVGFWPLLETGQRRPTLDRVDRLKHLGGVEAVDYLGVLRLHDFLLGNRLFKGESSPTLPRCWRPITP